ncbi:MAG: dTMP kinase [Nitrospirae bacterium]|nr:MAG: dTMP kinase [Nitrospirota bacterium]
MTAAGLSPNTLSYKVSSDRASERLLFLNKLDYDRPIEFSLSERGGPAVPLGGLKRGFFLSFEGIEGCGKTTQLKGLARRLKALGYLVVETREPGGVPISEQIRTLLLDPKNRGMDARCELLLYLASRAQHLADKVRPALEKGAVVLCDRFADATMAYQGYGRGLGQGPVAALNRFATAGLSPDLVILLDVPVSVGLSRKRKVGGLDRLDREHASFHEAVRRGYLRIARQNPRRVRAVDGAATEDDVARAIDRIVQSRLRARKSGLTRVERHAV